MDATAGQPNALGRRILIVGPSCSGKSTLANQLASLIAAEFIEMDALFWKPNWQEPDEDEFQARLKETHRAEAWVSAGNYLRHTRHTVWPRAETVIWLDFPISTTCWRVIVRSWRRWRGRELLWGTNTERFWDQFIVWNPRRSLIGYNVSRHRRNRELFLQAMTDPEFTNTRFIRLTSAREVRTLLAAAARGS